MLLVQSPCLMVTSNPSASAGRPAPPQQHRAARQPADDAAGIRPGQDRDRPPLPGAVPIQRDGHGAQPRAQRGARGAADDGVERRAEARERGPRGPVDPVYPEEREERQERQVSGAEERVRRVREQRGAEQHDGQVHDRRRERGEDDGEDDGLARTRAGVSQLSAVDADGDLEGLTMGRDRERGLGGSRRTTA